MANGALDSFSFQVGSPFGMRYTRTMFVSLLHGLESTSKCSRSDQLLNLTGGQFSSVRPRYYSYEALCHYSTSVTGANAS